MLWRGRDCTALSLEAAVGFIACEMVSRDDWILLMVSLRPEDFSDGVREGLTGAAGVDEASDWA